MKNFSRRFKLSAAALAASFAFVGAPALAEPVFTVDESVVPGSAANTFDADRITFGYQARIIQTINGGSLAGDDDPFVENGFLNKASFEFGAGNALSTQLNAFGAGGYKIYGVFTITGEADIDGLGILATSSSTTLTLFLDPSANTTLGFDGSNNVTIGSAGDDIALANLTLIAGEAHVFGGLANGDFDSLLNFALTPFGETFFVSPDPFYTIENFGGNTQTLTGASLTNSFVATATGAGVELFIGQPGQVPEPGTGSLSLLGLALLGLGAMARKKSAR